jgi:hypothetical protein
MPEGATSASDIPAQEVYIGVEPTTVPAAQPDVWRPFLAITGTRPADAPAALRSLSSLNCTSKWVRFLHTVKDEQYLLASLVYSAQRYSLLLSKLPFDVFLFLCSVVDLDPH